jgi:hypothetical protein
MDALGTPAVHEVQLSVSEYRPDLNERVHGPTMFVSWGGRLLSCEDRRGGGSLLLSWGDPSAVGVYHFPTADQACGEVGVAFPLTQVTRDKLVVRDIVQRFGSSREWHDEVRRIRES